MNKVIQGEWGYAVLKDGALWIPAISGSLGKILNGLYKKTGIKRMIFSAVMNPNELKKHLRNIKREFDVWFEEIKDWSHCIEIEYEEKETLLNE